MRVAAPRPASSARGPLPEDASYTLLLRAVLRLCVLRLAAGAPLLDGGGVGDGPLDRSHALDLLLPCTLDIIRHFHTNTPSFSKNVLSISWVGVRW